MTLCDLPIKTLLAFQRKQIYSEASLTHFSAINISYNYSLPIIILIVPNTSLHFRKLSDLSRNTIQFGTAIYQAKFFSPIIAIKYILKHLHHTFQLLIYHILRSTHHNPHCSKYITTFQKTIRLIAEHSLI